MGARPSEDDASTPMEDLAAMLKAAQEGIAYQGHLLELREQYVALWKHSNDIKYTENLFRGAILANDRPRAARLGGDLRGILEKRDIVPEDAADMVGQQERFIRNPLETPFDGKPEQLFPWRCAQYPAVQAAADTLRAAVEAGGADGLKAIVSARDALATELMKSGLGKQVVANLARVETERLRKGRAADEGVFL